MTHSCLEWFHGEERTKVGEFEVFYNGYIMIYHISFKYMHNIQIVGIYVRTMQGW